MADAEMMLPPDGEEVELELEVESEVEDEPIDSGSEAENPEDEDEDDDNDDNDDENGDDDDDDDDKDGDEDDDEENPETTGADPTPGMLPDPQSGGAYDYPSDDEDVDEETRNKKLLGQFNKVELLDHHARSKFHNYDEITALTTVTRNKNNIIVDRLHRTNPIMSKYERTKVLGYRTQQLNAGATPFVKPLKQIIDNYLIAEMELAEKKLPFIIQRPLPNGGFEYWHISDLEVL
jgi:DNA-directed RNA polymerase subunit K/omega